MYRKFENLSEDKKQKILDSAIEEFVQNGYEVASTNNIVKNADISKGILFHYFGNKKNLYLYLVDYTMDYFIKNFYSISIQSQSSTDIFERIIEQSVLKLKMFCDDPLKYKFILKAFRDPPSELNAEIMQRYTKIINENIPIFLKDIDTSKFRKDINHQKAIELMFYALEGAANKYIKTNLENLSELEKSIEDVKEYIDILKKGIYGN